MKGVDQGVQSCPYEHGYVTSQNSSVNDRTNIMKMISFVLIIIRMFKSTICHEIFFEVFSLCEIEIFNKEDRYHYHQSSSKSNLSIRSHLFYVTLFNR